MTSIQHQVADALAPLVGRKFSLARHILDVRALHFGRVERNRKGALIGEFVLNLNCPWRIELGNVIITGRHDHFARSDENVDPAWEVGSPWGTLQDALLRQLLGGYDEESEACVNIADHLVVEEIEVDHFGGAVVKMTGGYRLVIFPAGTRDEHWRLLPAEPGPHFVVEGCEAYWG